jgi:hypothetical protein
MMTVLEEYTTREQRSVMYLLCLRCILPKNRVLVCFLWAKALNAMYIHREISPVYGEKCLS